MFSDKTAWFSTSVHDDTRRLWRDNGGKETDFDAAMFIFSTDCTCPDTERVFRSRAYVSEHLAVFHSRYIKDFAHASDRSKVVLGRYFLPPPEILAKVQQQMTLCWEKGPIGVQLVTSSPQKRSPDKNQQLSALRTSSSLQERDRDVRASQAEPQKHVSASTSRAEKSQTSAPNEHGGDRHMTQQRSVGSDNSSEHPNKSQSSSSTRHNVDRQETQKRRSDHSIEHTSPRNRSDDRNRIRKETGSTLADKSVRKDHSGHNSRSEERQSSDRHRGSKTNNEDLSSQRSEKRSGEATVGIRSSPAKQRKIAENRLSGKQAAENRETEENMTNREANKRDAHHHQTDLRNFEVGQGERAGILQFHRIQGTVVHIRDLPKVKTKITEFVPGKDGAHVVKKLAVA